MARLARLYIPGLPQYLILEACPGQPAFIDDADLACFAKTLRCTARDTGFAIHAYALLPSGVHLLGTPRDAVSTSATVQAVGRRYVAIFNHRHGRRGTLWNGRYRATVIDPEHYLLFISRLIESFASTPPAGERPAEGLRRSSHAHHVGLTIDPLVTDHPLHWALGNTPFERQRIYRELSEQPLNASAVAHAIDAARKGWVLGSDAFQDRCLRLANRRVAPLQKGRPKSPKRVPQAPPDIEN